MKNPFRYFNSSPEIIRLTVMMYVRYPLSLRQGEDLLFERGIDICHETVRSWWNRFGPMFAAEIRKRRVQNHSYSRWRWHLDEVFILINGETHYLWRAVDHECDQTAGSQGCASVSEACDEAVWATKGDRDGPAPVVSRSDECDRQWRRSGMRALAQ